MVPRRPLLVAPLVALGLAGSAHAETAAPAVLTPADQGWIGRIETTLNAITTLKARFLQIDQSGHTTGGVAWLDRPDRMRFQYDKPSGLLLVADGSTVIFHDPKLDQTTRIPLDRTPLGLLLAPNIALDGNVTVTGFAHENGTVQVTLERTASPGDGSLTLVFSETPFALRSWSVIDAEGRDTRVDLYDVVLGGAFPASLFIYDDNQNG